MGTLTAEKIDQPTLGGLPTKLDDLAGDLINEALAVLPSLPESRRIPAEKDTGEPTTELPDDLRKSLRPLVRLSPPSSAPRNFDVRQRWEGLIVHLTENSLWAELSDLTKPNQPVETVEIPLDEISPGDRPILAEGAVFYWHIGFETKPGGQINRVSEIRMRRTPAWSQYDIEKLDDDARRWIGRELTDDPDDASESR